LGCLYADFDPATRNNPEDKTQPYRLPDYQLLDLHTYYTFEISKLRGEAGLSIYNAGGNTHILHGLDGTLHHSEGFTGFWSPGRTFSFSVNLSF
jgi:outer membrane receptor protein involved in Fe transport